MKKEMYRVLAADDEYWSRENLRSLFPWEERGYVFLEPARDGEEVLERMEEERPDILLTDINMPFLDGLELLKRLRENYPEVITVAVSGYDDFEKVKGVFISGGIDYLLKPVGKDDLERVIEKAAALLEKRKAEREREQHHLKQEDKIASFLEDGEYSALLTASLYGVGAEAAEYSVSLEGNAAALVKFYDIAQIAEDFNQDILQMSLEIKQKLRDLCRQDAVTLFHYNSKMSEFLVVGNAEEARLQRFAGKVLEQFPEETYGPVSVVLYQAENGGKKKISSSEIGTVYRELIASLVTRPFERRHSVVNCGASDLTGERMLQNSGGERLEEELYHLLKTHQIQGAMRLIFERGLRNDGVRAQTGKERCESSLYRTDPAQNKAYGWTYLEVRQYVGRITNTIFSYVQKEMPQLRTMLEEAMDNVDYYLKCLNAEKLSETLKIILEGLQEQKEQQQPDSVAGQMEQIRRRIEENYFENITLASLAEQYHVDASYLSRTFSRKYGESIISFLTRVRMEKAAQLMRDESRKLEAIAFLVGYDDYHYFSRVFRKKMGISPSEYRSRL